MTSNLFNLPLGKIGIIKNIKMGCKERRRLNSLGLIGGVEVSFVKSAPFGSPKIYSCLNTLIALRSDVSRKIEVEYEE